MWIVNTNVIEPINFEATTNWKKVVQYEDFEGPFLNKDNKESICTGTWGPFEFEEDAFRWIHSVQPKLKNTYFSIIEIITPFSGE